MFLVGLLLWLSAALPTEVTGFPHGAPCAAADTLLPNDVYHGYTQDISVSTPPYVLEVLDSTGAPVTMYKRGQIVTVRLSGFEPFVGFLLQARSSPERGVIGSRRVGKFLLEEEWRHWGVKYQSCEGADQSDSVTHNSELFRHELTLKWTAEQLNDAVQFVVTVMRNRTLFWAQWGPKSGFLDVNVRGRSTDRMLKQLSSEPTLADQERSARLSANVSLQSATALFPRPQQISSDSNYQRDFPNGRRGPARKPQINRNSGQPVRLFPDFSPAVLPTEHKSEVCPPTLNSCVNGTCLLEPDVGHICICPPGSAGQNCEGVNRCLPVNPCTNGGICEPDPLTDSFICRCPTGFAGKLCDISCPSYLCQNGGTCVYLNGEYTCACSPGWAGKACDTDFNDCGSSPCLNGGTCEDRFNSYNCSCPRGFMGSRCERPCLNVYLSCDRWREEDRCDESRKLTKFFDDNCALSCGKCQWDPSVTIGPEELPFPPSLDAFHFITGTWETTTSIVDHFPLDFQSDSDGYRQQLKIEVGHVPMFGTPSLHYRSISISRKRPDDIQEMSGFLTLKKNPIGTNKTAALLAATNNGFNLLEEGAVEPGKRLVLRSVYNASLKYMTRRVPITMTRVFTIEGNQMLVRVRKGDQTGVKKEFSLRYAKLKGRILY